MSDDKKVEILIIKATVVNGKGVAPKAKVKVSAKDAKYLVRAGKATTDMDHKFPAEKKAGKKGE